MAETAEVTERIRILLDLEKEAHDRAARASAREIVRLEKAYDPLGRATVKHQQEVEKLTKALEKGTITEARHVELLNKVQAEYDQATAKIIKANAALAANETAGGGVVGMLGRNQNAVQQLGYQVGDFAVQVGNGTSAFTAFAQQGSQVLGVLGPYGAIAGAAVAIAAPLAAAFFNSGEEAKDAAEKLSDLQEATENYTSLAEEARRPIAELRAEYGSLADEVQRNIDVQRALAGVAAGRSLEGLASDAAGRFGSLTGDVTGDDGQSSYAFEKTFRRLRSEFDLTGAEAQELMNALRRLDEAEGPREVLDAASALQALMVRLAGSIEAAGDRFGETFTIMGDLIENASEQSVAMTTNTEMLLEVWRKLEEPTRAFADQLARALGFATRLDGLSFDGFMNMMGLPGAGTWLRRGEGMQAATDLIRSKEGFLDTAEWDQNHYRAGYGSDTYTDAEGNVRPVEMGTTVSIADAERDLQRRIGEYFNTIIDRVGIDRFNTMSAPQQGALASLLHNYGAGELRQGGDLSGVLEALVARNDELVAQRIVELGAGGHGDTQIGNSLRARRREEAQAFGSADATLAQQSAADQAAAKATREAAAAERERTQAAESSQRAVDALRGSTGDAASAEWKYAEAIKTVEEALRRGQITQQEAAEIRERLKEELDRTLENIDRRAERDSPFKQLQKDAESLTETLLRTAAAGGDVGAALRNFLLDAAIKAAAQNLTQLIGGIFGGGGGGGLGSIISGIFGGKRAAGGPVQAGVPYLVNEHTPNSEVMVPSRSGGILNVSQAQAALRGSVQGSAAPQRLAVEFVGSELVLTDNGTIMGRVRMEQAAGLQASMRASAQQFGNIANDFSERGTT